MYRKASKPFAIADLLLFCNVVFPSGKLGRMGASSSGSGDDEVQVRQVLADVGAKNGVTFTIEEALLKGRGHGPHSQLPPPDNPGRYWPYGRA